MEWSKRIKMKCTYSRRCKQEEKLEVCNSNYLDCFMYKRYKNLEPKTLEEFTYNDWLRTGIDKMDKNKNGGK